MRYRKLTSTGDYRFGQSQDDFLTGIEATAQACKTRLDLWQGNFWRDLSDGLPMLQQILGQPGSAENLASVDSLIAERIRNTPEVQQVVNYSSTWDPETRAYTFTASVQTQDSETVIAGGF